MTSAVRRSGPAAAAWVLTLIVMIALGILVARRDRASAGEAVVLFSARQTGCAIVVPAAATAGERRAAETLQATLARASGRTPREFPIFEERGAVPRRGVWVGATRRGSRLLNVERKPPFDTAVGFVVQSGALFLQGERREAGEGAVGWFLERQLGAQWFMPGPLGEHVPRREELVLAPGEVRARPGFIHRDLGLDGSPEAQAWYGRNRLEARFEHGHNLTGIFRPADFQRTPEMAPMRNGRRFFPPATSGNWQPNLTSQAAVRHAAEVVNRAFEQEPRRVSFSLSINDTDLYDESAATLAAVSPPRYFRHRPDYSKLVFGFTNAVAELVAQRHPDRWLPAYAYYWCENTPGFPIAKNVIPFLTADRSQWAHPEFAAEDKALIERWCRSGAGIVGAYDYYYGTPHFAPRPTLYAVKQSIPFMHRAGVRAFYAETYANWALDGPKPWMAAKLLWEPGRDPDELLDLYFREFWVEAAEPMRAFYAVAERTWLEQPGPPLWLRFYKDEDQAWIYPPARRAELRAQLNLAADRASTAAVRARVAFVADGLAVSEAYWEFAAAREAASRLARDGADAERVLGAWQRYRLARANFVWRFDHVRREQPLAIAPQEIESFLRNEPDGRIARALSQTAAGRALLHHEGYLPWRHLGATGDEIARVLNEGAETLKDPAWRLVVANPVGSSATSDWTVPGQSWLGSGEAWEGRTVQLSTRADGRRVLRLAGCRTEGIGQWVPVSAGALYAATVKVRAKTSPGTATFLIVSFLDEQWRHIDMGRVDRLPPAAAVQETTLCVIRRAPPNARFVGYGVRVLNQINDDFVEYNDASLRRLDP